MNRCGNAVLKKSALELGASVLVSNVAATEPDFEQQRGSRLSLGQRLLDLQPAAASVYTLRVKGHSDHAAALHDLRLSLSRRGG